MSKANEYFYFTFYVIFIFSYLELYDSTFGTIPMENLNVRNCYHLPTLYRNAYNFKLSSI